MKIKTLFLYLFLLLFLTNETKQKKEGIQDIIYKINEK